MDINKLKNFEGGLYLRLKLPEKRSQWVSSAKKIIQFYHRIDRKKIYWIPLLRSITNLASLWIELADSKMKEFKLDQYVGLDALILELTEIRNSSLIKMLTDDREIILEESRERIIERCSLCRVPLVYPAYVIHRKYQQVISKSAPIGIMCLHNYHGKLEKLVKMVEISLGKRLEEPEIEQMALEGVK